MIKFLKNFRKDDSGAVTVDWVVLTAAVVVLAGAVYASIEDGASNLTENTGTFLKGLNPGADGAAAPADPADPDI